jgi:hypothetical protein
LIAPYELWSVRLSHATLKHGDADRRAAGVGVCRLFARPVRCPAARSLLHLCKLRLSKHREASARRRSEGLIDCLAYIRLNFDHHRTVRRHCFRDDLGRLRCVRDRIALRAECSGKGREVVVGQVRTPTTFRKCSLLMRTAGAVRLVVGDHDLDIEPA